MSAVGKKKRVVYVKSKKSPLIPLLIVGGVAIWWFTRKKDDQQRIPDVQQPAQDPVTGEVVVQPPPVVADNANATALQTAAAVANRAALLYYDPANAVKYKQMNDIETNYAYDYVFSYVRFGKKLYRLPDADGIFPDGGWNTQLYDAVKALQMKYGIFL